MFPVAELPIVNVWPFVVPKIPRPESVVAIFPELAEIEAVGVPELTFMNANLAEAVEIPPSSRSTVVLFANIAPFACPQFKSPPVSHDPQEGLSPPIRHCVFVPAPV